MHISNLLTTLLPLLLIPAASSAAAAHAHQPAGQPALGLHEALALALPAASTSTSTSTSTTLVPAGFEVPTAFPSTPGDFAVLRAEEAEEMQALAVSALSVEARSAWSVWGPQVSSYVQILEAEIKSLTASTS